MEEAGLARSEASFRDSPPVTVLAEAVDYLEAADSEEPREASVEVDSAAERSVERSSEVESKDSSRASIRAPSCK
jgi:hypothetical protein